MNDHNYDFGSEVENDVPNHLEQQSAEKPHAEDADASLTGEGFGLILSLLLSGGIAIAIAVKMAIAGALADNSQLVIAGILFVISCGLINVKTNLSKARMYAIIAGIGLLWVRTFILFKYDALIIESHWLCVSPVFIALFSIIFCRDATATNRS